jgi:hypothetical protein
MGDLSYFNFFSCQNKITLIMAVANQRKKSIQLNTAAAFAHAH